MRVFYIPGGRFNQILHGCSFFSLSGENRLKLMHSCSFSPRIPSNLAQTEEIAAHLQDFFFPDLRSRKKLQNCSFGQKRATRKTSFPPPPIGKNKPQLPMFGKNKPLLPLIGKDKLPTPIGRGMFT